MTSGDLSLNTVIASVVDRAAAAAVERVLDQANTAGAGPLTYRTSTAAEVLDVSQDTIERLLDAGELEYVDHFGQGRMVTRESLVALVDRNRKRQGESAADPTARVNPSRRPRGRAA